MKIPKPRRLSSGTWFLQMRLGGVSVPVTGRTAKECRDIAAVIKSEHRAGKCVTAQDEEIPEEETAEPQPPTLHAAIDAYIDKRSAILSPSTIDGYRRIQKKRFASVMKLPISSDTDWQAVIDAEHRAGISGKTIENAYGFIKSVLGENGIHPPKITMPKVQINTRPWLDFEEIKVFLKAAEGTNAELPALLALHSLRRSELLAVTWDDITLGGTSPNIRVSGAIVQDEHHKYVDREENKTVKSARTVPIMIPRLLQILRDTPAEDRAGRLVTCYPHRIPDRINAVCRAAGLTEVGTHGLRHSFASLAYHLRWSELQTQETGGWSDARTVHTIYTHIAQKDRLQAHNSMKVFYGFPEEQADKNAN